jgi:hypothetical protein
MGDWRANVSKVSAGDLAGSNVILPLSEMPRAGAEQALLCTSPVDALPINTGVWES